jgi:hypothetical protein
MNQEKAFTSIMMWMFHQRPAREEAVCVCLFVCVWVHACMRGCVCKGITSYCKKRHTSGNDMVSVDSAQTGLSGGFAGGGAGGWLFLRLV